MFDLVRKHTKVLMFVMFLLVIPAFVLVGIDGYSNFSSNDAKVASVAGRDITQAEWDFAHRNDVERMRASMPNIDPKLLDSAAARYATLERLVRERVLAQAAEKEHLSTSNVRLAQELQRNPTIAALRGPDGKLDMERYRQLAAGQGLTPEGFEARVRRDLSLRQVEAGVLSTGFMPEAIADVTLGAFFEKREVQVMRFPSSDYVSKVSPTDAEIDAYYKEHAQAFQAPESVSIEYVVLDLPSAMKSIAISEQDLKSYYDQNVERLSGTEERRASHILIAAPKDAPQAERDKAKARAEELLAQVRKDPSEFAAIAKKDSQDPGSAPSGGDLGFFARGAMVKPFEDAAFGMKKGDIELVQSDFGYHIIMVTDVKSPKPRSFDELRPGIEADLKSQQAQRKFSEAAESFTNGVYEQSDSLKPVADKLKLEIKSASGVLRTPTKDAQGPLANEKFLSALFSDDAIKNKRNTEAIEVGPNQLVSGRVVSYAPARSLPLAEVKTTVREKLVATRAAELARKDGEARLAKWKSNPAQFESTPAVIVARDQPQGITPTVLDAALRADPTALPLKVGVDLGVDGYAVVNIKRIVSHAAPDDAQAKQARVQVAQLWTAAENRAYYDMLKERYKVRINVPRPDMQAVGQ